jgi:hypothetical protein
VKQDVLRTKRLALSERVSSNSLLALRPERLPTLMPCCRQTSLLSVGIRRTAASVPDLRPVEP